MKLIAITGIDHAEKRRTVEMLADAFVVHDARVQIIDNADQALRLDYPTWRLPGGCACCTLAFGLIDLVNRLDCEVALIPVSGSAAPDALALVLSSLRAPGRSVSTLALVSDALWSRSPYLAGNLCSHADFTIASAGELEGVIDALV
jgi:G3E family GTPase